MMIKLFLITLLCATLVFANSPVQFQDMVKPMNGFVSNMADYFKDHGSSLVRRSAYTGGGGGGGAGGGANGGFGFGMTGGAGGNGGGGWGRRK